MADLDFLGATIGMEGMDIAKMFGGLLQGTGGLLSAGQKKDDKGAAEKLKLEEEKRKAEQSAATMKTALIAGGAVAVTALGVLLFKRK